MARCLASQNKENNLFSQGNGRVLQENTTLPYPHQRYQMHENLTQIICIHWGLSGISKWFHLSCYIVARLQVSENQLKVIKLKGEFTVWYNLEVPAWLDPGTYKTASRHGFFLFVTLGRCLPQHNQMTDRSSLLTIPPARDPRRKRMPLCQ